MPGAADWTSASGMPPTAAEPRPPRLVIGIGNPSRGDDALGPLLVEALAALRLPGLELLTDYQLQVEYVLDLKHRQQVFIIDAAASGPAPFRYEPVGPAPHTGYTTHQLSPAALLTAYRAHHGSAPPPCHVLAVRGYRFDMGQPLSPGARRNLQAALGFLRHTLTA